MLQNVKTSMGIIFSEKRYRVIALISTFVMALLYIYASQIITFFPDGSVYFEFSPLRIFTIIVVSTLFGFVVPMQLYALKIAKSRAKESGAAFSGIITGMLGMSCCAPILPSLLVFFGFSGTFLLSLNMALQRYLIPLSLLSILLLILSISLLSKNITSICKINSTSLKRETCD